MHNHCSLFLQHYFTVISVPFYSSHVVDVSNRSCVDLMSAFLHFSHRGDQPQSSGVFSHMQESLIISNLLWKLLLYKILQGSLKSGPQKRTDLVFLKSRRTWLWNTQSSSLPFPSPGNEDRLSEFVWHVPLFLPVRSCRNTSTVHMEINWSSPQLLQILFVFQNYAFLPLADLGENLGVILL